jgi:prophage regulatory protein
MAKRIIRITEVSSKTGMSRSSIYERVKDGSFPSPIKITNHAVGWIEKEVEDWITHRIAKTRNPDSK